MFKTISFLIAALVASQPVFSQETDCLGMETGLVINNYFPKEKISPKNTDPFNYYFRFEYTGHTLTRKKWSVFIPMGVLYSYYNRYAAASVLNNNINNVTVYHHFIVFVGPQLQYHDKNLRAGGALMLNNRYVSARVFGLYRLTNQWWIGPAFELFFYDILYSVDEFKNRKNIPNYSKNNFFGLNGNALRFNAGIKLQMDLKL